MSRAKGQASGVIDAYRFGVVSYSLLQMSAKIADADDTNDPDESQRGIHQGRRTRVPEYPRQRNEEPDGSQRQRHPQQAHAEAPSHQETPAGQTEHAPGRLDYPVKHGRIVRDTRGYRKRR